MAGSLAEGFSQVFIIIVFMNLNLTAIKLRCPSGPRFFQLSNPWASFHAMIGQPWSRLEHVPNPETPADSDKGKTKRCILARFWKIMSFA
jgi:hypothetical protein